MNPELESSIRDVLTQILARDDFPAELVDSVSTYLVTGKVPGMSVKDVYGAISHGRYAHVFWLLFSLDHIEVSRYHLEQVRKDFQLYEH